MSVSLQVPDDDPPLAGWLDAQTQRVMGLAGIDHGELNIAVVGDDEMRRLHAQHLGVPETTDVLTFDMREDPGDPVCGDVVICLDEARRQAATRGHDARLEALLYSVHALLHLLGFDDKSEEAAHRMHLEEDALLGLAGFRPVFQKYDAQTTPQSTPGRRHAAHTGRALTPRE